MKRNYRQEIEAIKNRGGFITSYGFRIRLNKLDAVIDYQLKDDFVFQEEILKYIPVATVACFEAFFRAEVKRLIDYGEPFSRNASKFNHTNTIKFDFEIVSALQDRSISGGELIAHLLPCSKLENINSALSTLIDEDFLSGLKTFEKPSIFEGAVRLQEKFRNNSDRIIADVRKTFELRHIICHEFANDIEIEKKELLRYYENCKLFLEQADQFISHVLYPDQPETQTDMNIRASEDFREADKSLNDICEKIKTAKGEGEFIVNHALFDETIDQWKNYRESYAKMEAKTFEGGTMYSMIYAGAMTSVTMDMIEDLKRKYHRALGQGYN